MRIHEAIAKFCRTRYPNRITMIMNSNNILIKVCENDGVVGARNTISIIFDDNNINSLSGIIQIGTTAPVQFNSWNDLLKNLKEFLDIAITDCNQKYINKFGNSGNEILLLELSRGLERKGGCPSCSKN
jgi:hypothetical protein